MAKRRDTSARDEFAMLGRGIVRTFVRDVLAVVAGAAIGAGAAYVFRAKFGVPVVAGALVGAFVGLAMRSLLKPLFDYDQRPRDGQDGP